MLDRRRFGMELLGLGTLLGCSAPTRIREDAGVDAGPRAECPSGAKGIREGDILADVPIQAYRGAQCEFGPLSLCEYWDPDGSLGIRAFLLILGASWCPPCRDWATALRPILPAYTARGVRVLELLCEGDRSGIPAVQSNVDAWIKTFGVSYDIGIVSSTDLWLEPMEGIPINYYVDPRTMRIVTREHGWPHDEALMGKIPALDAILAG
ncbi:MAG: TlpA family protein disulfide reductase [Polyangiales bacterium]